MKNDVWNTFKSAREFIYRNARPLDLALWQYHFEKENNEAVIKALSYYQNDDGGFAHGLEPDSLNPYSSPIQTWVATEIINEIELDDAKHPMIKKILAYLASKQDFENNFWLNTVKTNNDFPHAPWWHYKESESIDYNPTACLAGFIIYYVDKNSELYHLGVKIAHQAIAHFHSVKTINEMHTIANYVSLLKYIEKANVISEFDIDSLKIQLRKQVTSLITKDTNTWKSSYVCKPSRFIDGKSSIFYQDNKELADYECRFIIQSQLADGSYEVPWHWQSYQKEWLISENWWKSDIIIKNMLYLKGFDLL